jgi:hypothetical protein
VLSDPMRRAVYDREAEEIPVRRTDVARPAETVIARRHSAEPLTPVQPVGGFEDISLLRSFETFLPSFSEMFDPSVEQLRTRDPAKSRAAGKPDRGCDFVAPRGVCGRADAHSGAGPSDLSGMPWPRECRTVPMLAL